MLVGTDCARAVVVEHMAGHGTAIEPSDADRLLDEWRLLGIPRDDSLGQYLDGLASLDSAAHSISDGGSE